MGSFALTKVVKKKFELFVQINGDMNPIGTCNFAATAAMFVLVGMHSRLVEQLSSREILGCPPQSST